jgi:hypothetical protein
MTLNRTFTRVHIDPEGHTDVLRATSGLGSGSAQRVPRMCAAGDRKVEKPAGNGGLFLFGPRETNHRDASLTRAEFWPRKIV